MEMLFRWYGENDPVTLEKIRQIPGVTGIVSAVYDIPVGQVWPLERILRLKNEIEAKGLSLKVIESVPVHENIKLGRNADEFIENYKQTIRNLAQAGVYVVCYNFMPVFDWMRSDLAMPLPDGSNALAYDHQHISNLDRENLSLPGWNESYAKEELKALLDEYRHVDEEALWKNFSYFINSIMPVCDEVGVSMAIHPDDPPWGIFGLPRIITGIGSYERMIKINDSINNGITFCAGSLGSSGDNDLPLMAKTFAKRIHFAHMRNVLRTSDRSFNETAHPSQYGSIDMYAVLKSLYEGGFGGFIRPDHGRMIWGETGRAGYGLYDRALGATYLSGLWEAITKSGDGE